MPSLKLLIRGQVQGLGFRPYVYRLAKSMGINGTVANSSKGVEIIAQGGKSREFAARLRTNPPPLARITYFKVRQVRVRTFTSFRIIKSSTKGGAGVDVLPDLAVCADCRKELLNPKDRRFLYPFINCTQCGPRYTIIKGLPYDRPRTTMRSFQMCPDCAKEYHDPLDRRFHAQPNACPRCGPELLLLGPSGKPLSGNPIEKAAQAIDKGKIVAVKSLGGFQLACDALNDAAVRRLRRRKARPSKPLALMCENTSAARRFCRIGQNDKVLLTSPATPVVLLSKKASPTIHISPAIAPKNSRYGVMLPYTPLHIVLLRAIRRLQKHPPVLVMTSANNPGNPITAHDSELLAELGGIDLVLTHNRPIANRCDDSVVLAGKTPLMVRRARGYVPQPLFLNQLFHVKQSVLAFGGEPRNCFALASAGEVFLSPYIGRLESRRAERFFLDTLERYFAWTKIKPERIACDLHPDYLSTRLAERLSVKWHLPLFRVQHHYAHCVSVIAEHGVKGPALGLAFDGTGYGTDRAIWGCEFFLVEPDLNWHRVGHLKYLQLTEPGNIVANPGRVAAAYLIQTMGSVPRGLGLEKYAGPVQAMLNAGRSVPTSSLGRLFDAVAGIAGICREATFEGEAAIALEAAARSNEQGHYFKASMVLAKTSPCLIAPEPILAAVVSDTLTNTKKDIIAARFHNTIVQAAVTLTRYLARKCKADTILLSGGSFQNDLLRHGISVALTRQGYRVVHNQLVPVNDGGISLGQALAVGLTEKFPKSEPVRLTPTPVCLLLSR